MNPELPQPIQSPEIPRPDLGGVEYGSTAPERGAELGQERQPSAVETTSQPAPVLPAVPTPVASDDNATTQTDSMLAGVPSVANDDDVIEKEWVDKIKKIISLTRDNPYERARVIAEIQADYLKKRYNKTLGQAED